MWAESGGYTLLLTLTASHRLEEGAADVLADLMSAWSELNTSRGWRKLKSWLGLEHWLRVTEMPRSDRFGWHPHHHVVLMVRRPVGLNGNPEELEEVRGIIHDLWSTVIEKRGRQVHERIGVDLKYVDDPEAVGSYVSKIELEVARGDLKRSKDGSRSPWQIALDAYEGDAQSVVLWREYVAALKGRQWLSTSNGLWQAFGMADKTDEKIAEETPEIEDERLMLESDLYMALSWGEHVTELRHLVEALADAEIIRDVLGRRLKRRLELAWIEHDEKRGEELTLRFYDDPRLERHRSAPTVAEEREANARRLAQMREAISDRD